MRFLFIPLIAALSACGGSGGGEATPATPQAPTCSPVAVVQVELYGDSTQSGYGGEDGGVSLVVNTPRVALQQALNARFGAGTTLVVDRSVGGSTAQDLVNGDGRNAPWPQSITGHIVVINHGLLDMTHYGGPRFNEYPVALERLAAVPAGVRVVFETPNAAVGWDASFYAQAMRQVADRHAIPVADVYAFHSSMPDWQAQLGGDWAHPTDGLYKRITDEVVAPAVIPLVASMRCE